VDVVLAEYGITGVDVLALVREAGLPLVVHFHGYDAYNSHYVEPRRQAYCELFEWSHAVVGVSRAMCDRLVDELGAPRNKVHYIPYFIDPSNFQGATPGNSSQLFLSVGRFVEKKAPHLTILAFSRMKNQFPNARLEMVGDGPLLGACKWLAKALSLEDAIQFHGVKPREWIAEAMQRATAFVQHSVTAGNGDSEGTPLAILEAQCTGLPVVATRHAGICDVVVSGETGFLAEEGDVATMADGMRRVLELPQNKIDEMSEAARFRVLTQFSKEWTLDRLAALLQSCVSSSC
jgi:glycosyltransferase involved in cell wall biosynthesis